MQNSARDSQVNAITAGLKTDNPGVEIKSYALAGDGIARVVVDVTHTQASRDDHNLVAKALRSKLGNKMEAVAGSFIGVDKGSYVERVTGLVGVVREIRAIASDKDMNGFRCTAANMFMDDEKDMWQLKKTEAGQIMIKTSGIDDDASLVNLLDSCSSAGHRSSPEYGKLCAMASGANTNVTGGNFVSFVDMNNTIQEGFVVATASDADDVLVLQTGAEDAEAIKLGAITEVHDTENFPDPKFTEEEKVDQAVAASRGAAPVEAMVAYYRKIYSMNPKFFAEFEKRIRGHSFC